MSALVYSIAKTATVTEMSGVDDQPVRSIDMSGLCVYYSELDEKVLDPKAINPEDHPALIFQEVISSIHQQGPSLPMQFGLLLDSIEAIQRLVEANLTEIRKELNRIGPTYEYSFHFHKQTSTTLGMPERLTKADSPGAQYLLKKYQETKKSTQLGADMDKLSSNVERLTSEYLIEIRKSNQAETIRLDLRLTIGQLDKKSLSTVLTKDFPDYRIYIFGPYPPSHFVKLRLKTPH